MYQDPSTSLACELLQAKPGEKILDACAAPGGKTGHIAELMGNQGLLVAVDSAEGINRIIRERLHPTDSMES
jgi:16S rRNA (cytosine967-C5)-methyltransferase